MDDYNSLLECARRLEAKNERYRIALEKMLKPEGAFSRDQLVHAKNTIYWVITTAHKALEGKDIGNG